MKNELTKPDQSAFNESNFYRYRTYNPPKPPKKDFIKENNYSIDICINQFNSLNMNNNNINMNNNNNNNNSNYNNIININNNKINDNLKIYSNVNQNDDCNHPCDFLFELANM